MADQDVQLSRWAAEKSPAGLSRGGREADEASRYCPQCDAKLELRSCKLVCAACGYYMSCSDFY